MREKDVCHHCGADNRDMEDIKIAREETDLEWRPVLDGVHAYADLRRLGRRLAAERHVTDETIACLTGELERAIADVEKLTRERDEARELWRREETRMREAEWALDAAGVSATAPMPPGVAGCQTFSVAERIGTLAAQRDEARADAARLRQALEVAAEILRPWADDPAHDCAGDEETGEHYRDCGQCATDAALAQADAALSRLGEGR